MFDNVSGSYMCINIGYLSVSRRLWVTVIQVKGTTILYIPIKYISHADVCQAICLRMKYLSNIGSTLIQ